MRAKPWARAIAAIPLRPAPSPTTAAAPAPMNTKEKVPMNSARSLGAIRLDIVDSRDEIDRSARSGLRQGTIRCLGGGRRHGRAPPAANRAGLLRGDRLRSEIDAQRLRDASAVCRIGSIEVNELALDDLDRHAVHRRPEVFKQLLLLIGRHQPEQVSGLTIVVVAVAMIVSGRVTHDLERRGAGALLLREAG